MTAPVPLARLGCLSWNEIEFASILVSIFGSSSSSFRLHTPLWLPLPQGLTLEGHRPITHDGGNVEDGNI